ncbi:MAG: hypothetical protein KatS3mg102_1233 [Planctomycetota bacterium]|nr:MAG: hypothetical protein KatS3mg102_1233 [Planctomycetota bacterium]
MILALLGPGTAALAAPDGGGGAAPAAGDRAAQGSAGEDRPARAAARSIEDWIRDLGAADFHVREEATRALAAAGPEAIPALERAAQSPDPEVRWRAAEALKAVRARAAARPGAEQPQPAWRGEQLERAPRPDGPAEFGELFAEALRELERELGRLAPEPARPLEPSRRLRDLLAPELQRAFAELERALRETRGERPPVFRDFWTFRFKDGQWVFERGGQAQAPPEGALGLKTEPLGPLVRAQLGLQGEGGVAIARVEPHGLGARAGLRQWDIVTHIDGVPVAHPDDLLALREPGEHTLRVVRAGKAEQLRAHTPAAAPERTLPEQQPAPPAEQPAPRGDF